MKNTNTGLTIEAIHVSLQLFAATVIPSNAAANMMNTGSTELNGAFQKANDAKFIEIHKEALVFDKYLGSTNISAHTGNTVRFPKKVRIAVKNTKLEEGKTPDPSKIELKFITGTVEQHGDYVMFTDVALGTSIYDLMDIARENQAYQAAELKNALIRDDILADPEIGVAYAENNGTVDLVRKLVTIMKRNNIRPATGSDYVMFIHPDQWYDLTSDPAYQEMHKYTDATPLMSGEVGRISGCRFVETSTVLVTKTGASNVGVYHSIMLGADAVDQIKMAEGGVKTIGKGLGSGGTADPLDQRATVGWKLYHGCKVKDPLAVIEVITGSFNSNGIVVTELNTTNW